MFEYMAAVLAGTIFILFARWLVKGDPAMSMVSSLLLVCLVLYIVPELRAAPVAAYFMAWLLAFTGLQFGMPWAEGNHVLQWGTRRFVVAEIITAG